MSTTYVVAAPNFENGNERYISDCLYDAIKGSKVYFTGDIDPDPGSVLKHTAAPLKKKPGQSFYDDCLYSQYIMNILNSPILKNLEDGDILVFCDFWTPGMDLFKYYISMGLQKDVKFVGYLHGATFVPGDMMPMERWIMRAEDTWMEIYDQIWCASKFFADSVPYGGKDKTRLIGEPFFPKDYSYYKNLFGKKEYSVCFPHRLEEDKKPKDLIKIAKMLPDHKFLVMGNSVVKNKYTRALKKLKNVDLAMNLPEDEHMQKMASAKIVLSTAIQEGWGYGVMKAIAVGCVPVLPNRAVYPELYPKKYIYEDLDEACQMIKEFDSLYPEGYKNPKKHSLTRVNKCIKELQNG